MARQRARPVALRRRRLGAATSDLPALAAAFGAPVAAKLALPFVLAAALAVFVFKDREFRASPEMIVGGIVIGLVIVGGWYVSGHVGYVAEDPATLEEKFFATNSGRMESFTFVAPYAYTLELLMLWSDTSRIVTFGVASVLGMLAGSAAYALASRTFRWEGFGSVEDVANHLVGARPDGLRRRDRAGLHDRAGHYRGVDACRRLVPGAWRRSSPAACWRYAIRSGAWNAWRKPPRTLER